jgi:2-iminobutanoate/2-iminopropanoate deaminase
MFKNVKAVMDGANTDASHVLKTTASTIPLRCHVLPEQSQLTISSSTTSLQVFLKDMGDFAKFNAIYEKFYSPYKPARSCVEVARLPKDVLCELEFIAIEKK